MKTFLFFLSFCISSVVFSQFEISINAYLFDENTYEPVPYANIGFFNKSIGTVSGEDGNFRLKYDESLVGDNEIFQISSLGYETIIVKLLDLKKLLKNTNKILLKPKNESLAEVFLTNENRKDLLLGKTSENKDFLGYWKDKLALGGEITNKISVRRKNTKLKEFKFYVQENNSDSLKIRVNIYDYKRSKPEEKILKENLFHTIKIKKGEVNIDLKPYNITVDNDFVIGIELVKVYGEIIEFAVSGSKYTGPAFKRYVSQDKWQKHPEVGMNFSVLTSVPNAKQNEDVVQRVKPNKITLYWDVSFFRNQKDIVTELELLSKYLKSIKKVDVEVVKFNNDIFSKKEFKISRGDSKDLIAYLDKSIYYGGRDYSNILKSNKYDAQAILLFTNGNSLFSELISGVGVPVFTVNSSKGANHNSLQKVAYSTDGHYVNLNITSKKEALNSMLNEVVDTKDYNIVSVTPVNGKVVNNSGPIQGAIVKVKNTLNEVETDFNGYFKINATDGDDLIINALGMMPKQILAKRDNLMNIKLQPDGELLEEIEVRSKSVKNELINTANGNKNRDAVAYGAQTLNSKDFNKAAVYLVDLIRGRFAGVRTQGLGPDAKFFVRGISSIVNPTPAAFEINGIIYRDAPSFLNPQQIENITLLSSLASTNRYGSLGRGGVFKIELKTFKNNIDENGSLIDRALVTGNNYDENIRMLTPSVYKSESLSRLETSSSYQEAIANYNSLLNDIPKPSIAFYLEASDYFTQWDTSMSTAVLERAAISAYNNAKALKALAYKLDEKKDYHAASILYERISILNPKSIQSYRDLAQSYLNKGNYDASMKLYKKMLNNSIQDLDFSPLSSTITNEIKNLSANHRLHVNYKDLNPSLLSAKFNIDLRIVFEWSDPNAEFEFQFVNPKKKYYKWKHTILDNQDRLKAEIASGYHMEEFIIDDADSGEWIINIEGISKVDSLNPTYLKYTVFSDYGLPTEKKRVQVLKLETNNEKLTLDKFLYNQTTASNTK